MRKQKSPDRMALELVLPLYESLFDPDQRHAILDLILEHVGGTGAIWFSADDVELDDNFLAFIGQEFDPALYLDHFFEVDGWHEFGQTLLPGDTMHLSEEFNRKEFAKAEFYNDFALPHLNAASICAAIINPKTFSHFSVYRGPGDPAFSDDTLKLWETLNPHLQNWSRLYSKIGKIEHCARLLSDTLNTLTLGLVIVDDRVRISEMNAAAEQLILGGDALSVGRGTIQCREHNDTNLLHSLVIAASRTSQGRGFHPGGALRILSSDGRPLDIAISPLRRSGESVARRGQALMLISDPSAQRQSRAEILQAIYGMTPAEADVADWLARGKNATEISEVRGVSVTTVQTQIKVVLSKTDARNKSEFIKSVAWLDAISTERMTDTP